jgi:hypothetical protein
MAQLPVDPKSILAGFKRSAERPELSTTEGAYLKLDKSGAWIYGSEEVEVEAQSRWAINPQTMGTGFAAWGDSEKLGEEMALLMSDEPVLRSQLPDVGAQWNPQTAMQLKCVSGEDKGTEVVYSTTSKGGTKAFKLMVAAITAKLESGADDIIPIVELEVESYKHKKYGKIFTPTLKVVDWMGLGKLPNPDKAEAPAEAEAEAEAPAEEEAEAPRQRRRQRTA